MRKNLRTLLDNYFSEKIDKVTLDNGLTLIFKEDLSVDLISTQLWVKTGSIHEGQYVGSGLSHYLEHMLFKGTEKRSHKKITDDVQNAGGSMNAYTAFDRTVYYIDGPVEVTETALDVLSDIAFHSQLDPEEIAREKLVILREIDMILNEPDHQLHNNLFKTIYHEHPYRYPVIGERALFEEITREELYAYYKSRYVPNNMTLVIVGALPFEKIQALVHQYFASPKLKILAPVYIPEEPPQLTPRIDHRTGDFKITRGTMAYQIPGHKHSDTPTLIVFSDILGCGQSSVLWEELREKQHLVHSISVSAWSAQETGLLSVSYVCDPGKQDEIENAITQTLDQLLRSNLDPKKVEKAVYQSMVGEINIRKTMSGKASQLGFCQVVLGALDYPKIFIKHLETITPEKIKEVHRRYIKDTNRSSLSLSPKPDSDLPTIFRKKAPLLPDFEEIKLNNGATLLLQPYSKLPKVNIRTVFQGGPLYENPSHRGITGILAKLLTKDTYKRTAQQIAEDIESIGGVFSEFIGNNSLGLSLEVLPHDLALAQEILRDSLIQPKFTEEHFITERDAQIAAIKEELDEILAYGLRQLRQRFFNNHPYSVSPLGTIEALEHLTLNDVGMQKDRLIHPQNIVVAISGDFEREAIRDKFVPLIEELQNTNDFQNSFQRFEGPNANVYGIPLEKEQVVVLQAYPGVGVRNSLVDTSEVLDELLSGMSSNLFTHVREEKGMAYYIGAARMIGIEDGMFYLYGGTSKDNYKNVFEEIQKEVERLKSGNITDHEINRCKTRLKAGHRMGLQTPGARTMKAALDSLFGLPCNSWRTYADRISAVTKDQLQAFAQKKFQDSKKVCMSVGHLH